MNESDQTSTPAAASTTGQSPNLMQKTSAKFGIIHEFMDFLWKEKIWWMIPMVSVLLVVGLLILFAQASPIAPFIYTLF